MSDEKTCWRHVFSGAVDALELLRFPGAPVKFLGGIAHGLL